MIIFRCSKTRAKPLLAAMLVGLLSICAEIVYLNFNLALAQNIETTVDRSKQVICTVSQTPSPDPDINRLNESECGVGESCRLEEVDNHPKLTIDERVSLANLHGHTCYALGDSNCALTEFKKILAMREGLQEGLYKQTLYLVTQLSISVGNYSDALFYSQAWFDTKTEPSSDDYILLGQANYLAANYDDALSYALAGVKNNNDYEYVPKEEALKLLSDIYSQTGQFEKMLPVLEQLNEYYPNEIYWRAQREARREISYKQAK